MTHHHDHSPQKHWHDADGADTEALAEMLDLDAEVLHTFFTDAMGWIHGLAADLPREVIVDLGSGTGTGAMALANRFQDAQVTAVDVSPQFLARLVEKGRAAGIADRIHTLEADLDDGWPPIEGIDLVWASNSIHHVKDPGRVLADVYTALRPGGLLVVSELDSFPRVLPDEVGGGLEARVHAAMAQSVAEDVPHLGADWAGHLTAAGFDIVDRRQFVVDLTTPLPPSTGRYAYLTLRRVRDGLHERLNAADLAALDAILADAHRGVLERDDLGVRTARTVWVARRP